MCATIVTTTLAAGGTQDVRAATWSFTPEATLTTGYEDNVRLSPDHEIESASGAFDIRSKLVRSDDDISMSIAPRATLVRYEAQPVLNRNDWLLSGEVRKQFERGDWETSGSYARDTTLTSELGSTGLSEVNARHENVTASVGGHSILSERWNVGALAGWSAHEYADEIPSSQLVDYDYATLQLRVVHSIGERSSISFDASYGRLLVPTQDAVSENYAANLSFTSQFSRSWKFSASAGPTRIESDRLSDTGLGYSVSLERAAELTTLSFGGAREVTPTGRGVLSKRERLAFDTEYGLSERLRFDGSLRWIRNRDVLPTLGLQLDTVRYAQASAGIQWRMTSTWTSGVSLEWTRQQSEALFVNRADDTATGTRARLSFAWNGLRRSLH